VNLTSTTGKPASTPLAQHPAALVDRRDVFARNNTTLDGIDELVALAGFVRLDLEPDVTELTATTGLLDELAFLLDRLLDAFAIGNLRSANVASTLNSRACDQR
jgi:hypothetical protein